MNPQIYDTGDEKPLTKNAYVRTGYVFDGWKDPDGNLYVDGQSFKNNYFGEVVRESEAAQENEAEQKNEVTQENGVAQEDRTVPQGTLELVALWKPVASDSRVAGDSQTSVGQDLRVLAGQWPQTSVGQGSQTPVGQGPQVSVVKDQEKSRDQVTPRRFVDMHKGFKRSSSNWHKHYGQTFYVKNGKKLTGWQHLSGTAKNSSTEKNWFCFDKNGAMLTGRHRLAGGSPDAKGKTKERWFYFDRKTGRQVRGWVKDRKGAWYYYSKEDGAGLASGRYELEGGKGGGKRWFCFDEKGEQVRGWSPVGNQWYYYSKEDGAGLASGRYELEGGKGGGKRWFCFDEKGEQVRGWSPVGNQWYYYSKEDGAMLKGQHEIKGGSDGSKHWFYFDEITGIELRNCWKKIPSQNKTCYYGSDGAMYKGWRKVDGKRYYFDEATGALIR